MPAPQIDPNDPLTLASLAPWLLGLGISTVGVAVAVFRWIFQTTLIDEIKKLQIQVTQLTNVINDLTIKVAVLSKSVSDLEQEERDRRNSR